VMTTFLVLAVTGVLADSQKKIECNGRYITAGFCVVRHGVHPDFDEMVVDYGGRLGRQVWLCWWARGSSWRWWYASSCHWMRSQYLPSL
jgi:hypothetical protein